MDCSQWTALKPAPFWRKYSIYREKLRLVECSCSMFLGISWNSPPVLKKLILDMNTLPILLWPNHSSHSTPPKKAPTMFLSHDFFVQTPWGFVSLLFLSLYNYFKLFNVDAWTLCCWLHRKKKKNLAVFLWESFSLPGEGLWVDSYLGGDLLSILTCQPDH